MTRQVIKASFDQSRPAAPSLHADVVWIRSAPRLLRDMYPWLHASVLLRSSGLAFPVCPPLTSFPSCFLRSAMFAKTIRGMETNGAEECAQLKTVSQY
jgi:hypothetical protein